MTIRNIFYTAAYGVWIYVLLCLLVKLVMDRAARALCARRMKYIRRYFHPGGRTAEERRSQEARMQRYGQDFLLLSCACKSYRKGLPLYGSEERAELEALIVKMLCAASGSRERTVEERCTLAALAEFCEIPSERVSLRLWKREDSSAMQAFWRARRMGREGQRL